MISSVAVAGLAKRLVENPPKESFFPALGLFFYVADFIVFLPVILIVSGSSNIRPKTPS